MDIEKSWVPRGFVQPASHRLRGKSMCVVMYFNSDVHLYLVWLRGIDRLLEIELEFESSESFSRRSLKYPNLIIPGKLGDLRVCVAGNCLYMFFMHFSNPSTPKAYRIGLWSLANQSELRLEMSMLEEEKAAVLGPKLDLELIPYPVEGHGTVIILFSTSILWCHRDSDTGDDDDDEIGMIYGCDFEIFDPKGVLSRKLPQLLIRPKFRPQPGQSCQTFLLLHHSPSGTSISQEFASIKPFTEPSTEPFSDPFFDDCFHIISFGLNGSQFLVQTDFGNMFSLGLGWTNNEWRVCEEGIEFQSPGMNFVTRNGFCIDTHGINGFRVNPKFWRPWQMLTEKYESRRCDDFGISDIRNQRCCYDPHDIRIFGGYKVTLFDSYPDHNHFNELCMPCVFEVGVSKDEGGKIILCWYLDFFKIDLQKLALEAKYEDGDEDGDGKKKTNDEDEEKKTAGHLFSWQFDVPYDYVFSASPVAIFPFFYD